MKSRRSINILTALSCACTPDKECLQVLGCISVHAVTSVHQGIFGRGTSVKQKDPPSSVSNKSYMPEYCCQQ